MKKYDVLVIGSGSGAIVLEAALANGLSCAIIESGKFGGTCLTRGCIPTKVLATVADYMREFQEMSDKGISVSGLNMDWEAVSKRVWEKIDLHKKILHKFKSIDGLDTYEGTAKFINDHTVQILSPHAEPITISADKIFIATGARSKIPNTPGLEEAGYMTSETLFGSKYPTQPPKSIIIFGGGPIGTEFAHIFAAAGSKVTLLQHNKRLLPREDHAVSAQILTALQHLGIQIHVDCDIDSVQTANGEKIVTFTNITTGETMQAAAAEILVAAGVTPNTDILDIKNTSVEISKQGWVTTNEFLETSTPNIWAFGDVNGQPAFRHKANYEAEIVVHNLFSDQPLDNWRWARYDLVPAVTYTYPQVAHVGLTEQDAKKQGYEIKIGIHHFSSTAKAFALGLTYGHPLDGFVKLIVDAKTSNMLGMHIIGPQASVLLQPFVNLLNSGDVPLQAINEHIASPEVASIRAKKPVRYLDPHNVLSIGETMTPHPSLTEVTMWTKYYFEQQ